MIKELRLTNFRQHTKRTFNFLDGLNVFKGANESGKSTTIQALLYLWFGSKALNEPLSDVVTYGESEKSLRVEGDFEIDGVQYTAYRATSGAELAYGDQRVTGQTGVTQFMERLLGAKADVVRKLMIAEQNSVRGILESDSKAGALIEGLAELGIIDTLIEKIQNQLPTGPTKGLEATIVTLEAAVGAVPEKPTDDDVAAKADHAAIEQKVTKKAALVESMKEDVAGAKEFLKEAESTATVISTLSARKRQLEAVLGPAPCRYTQADLEAAELIERDQKYRQEVATAKQFVPLTCEASWTGTEASAEASVSELEASIKKAESEVSALRVQIASKTAMKINEGVCSFCKLDISERPEVVETNTAIDKEIEGLKAKLSQRELNVETLVGDLHITREILKIHRANMRKVNSTFWQVVDGVLPAAFKWIGPEFTDNLGDSVPSSEVKAALRDYEVALNRYTAAQQELASLSIPLPALAEEVESCKQILEDFDLEQKALDKLIQELSAAKTAVTLAEGAYLSRMRVYEAAVEAREKALGSVEDAKRTLAAMEFNNQLIKDVREARTEIRRRLWVTVTSAISIYFSRIRKVETLITQSEDGFLQNGRSVAGLSGSAKDMLGLAIRAALMKTFIPGAQLMVLDEPFSGADEDREVAGLSVLATLGFSQTILVTHSDLADAVASNLVQL